MVEKLYECNQHKQKIEQVTKRLEPLMPLDISRYEKLSIEDGSFIDQMIFRFSKLQDTMGEKLFPTLLEIFGEVYQAQKRLLAIYSAFYQYCYEKLDFVRESEVL